MLIHTLYQPVVAQFEEVNTVHACLSLIARDAIDSGNLAIQSRQYVSYINARNTYESAVEVLTLPMLNRLTSVEEVSEQFPEWRCEAFKEDDYEDVPFEDGEFDVHFIDEYEEREQYGEPIAVAS